MDLTAYWDTGCDRPYRKLQTLALDPTILNMDIFSFHSNFEDSETITNTARRPAATFSYAADSLESLADP